MIKYNMGGENMGTLLTVSEVAKRLKISRQSVHKAIQSGKFPYIKIGNLYRIDENWLKEYLINGGDKK